MTGRTIAVDWSGAKQRARRKIWLAEFQNGRCIRLECGRSREELTDHLIGEAQKSPDLIVGLDFAFSFPAWLLQEWRIESAYDLWRLAASDGERWLATCEAPFWGRPGTRRSDVPQFRRTELALPSIAGIRPKSVLQIGGAGAVGTGSIRGMPLLAKLRDAGLSIWPFDPPRVPVVVEIYPRVLTGPVAKTSGNARAKYLNRIRTDEDNRVIEAAASSEDAFDAFVSAQFMDAHRNTIVTHSQIGTSADELEGEIWYPSPERRCSSSDNTNHTLSL